MAISVEQLFHELADLTLKARERYYTDHDVDPGTREELEILLALDKSSSSLLQANVNAALSHALTRLETNNQQCGPYRLRGLLGCGGTGAVYLGERTDGEIALRVAVKLLRRGADNSQVRERFRAERQILASLSHPNIARLLDAGHREDGQPYLVMEYVEGKSLDLYAQGRCTREIIILYLKACSAVAYLHRNLIVHRDLKPGNILIDAEGEPKILDFGIAKMLDFTAEATVTGHQMLTPGYASPEQVLGGAVTTASDVYSMGAVLYRVLTGSHPRTLEGESVSAIVRSFSTNVVLPPSKLAPELGGDLDAIIMKALRSEPEERYATIEQMSEDLEDYLASRPIRVRKGEVWYRARKFLRRHWLSTAAVAFAIAGLAGGLLIANHERKAAQQRFVQVRQLAGRFIDLHDAVAHLPGSTKVREKIVSTALD